MVPGAAGALPPPVFTRWEGTEVWNYSPFLYTRGQRNVAITGPGTFEGQGREQDGRLEERRRHQPEPRVRVLGRRLERTVAHVDPDHHRAGLEPPGLVERGVELLGLEQDGSLSPPRRSTRSSVSRVT